MLLVETRSNDLLRKQNRSVRYLEGVQNQTL